jgi:hypothetical protein
MNRKKKVLSVFASALAFSIAGAGQAQAEDISVSVSTATPFVDFSVSSSGGVYEIVGLMTADWDDPVLQLYTDAAPTTYNTNSMANPANHVDENDDSGPSPSGFNRNYSAQLNGTSALGDYTIRVSSFQLWTSQASQTATYTLRYTGFIDRNRFRTSPNALRLDTAGTTTEKNNVVSCTPGKYTFLNGGSTAETAKVQSYVYTLLVNGKAVSTLSTDSFKSVTPHLFPTIAGNMAGTATLDGASWDLKGMSNYSAQCQVYATQSGGNIQSVTTTAHDSVALAAAAAETAKVQMAKDMIANWNNSNDELAKKLRDRRLAGKP